MGHVAGRRPASPDATDLLRGAGPAEGVLAVLCGTIIDMVPSPDWLGRYRQGKREQVWHEMRQLGSTIREPGLREEAQLVCDEMAQRARHNVEVITGRLSDAGYRFHSNNEAQTPVTPFVPATAAAGEYADWLEDRYGSVPMTLLSWLRLVGDVWLVGTHPQWAESSSADPLVIQFEGWRHSGLPVRGYFEGSFRAWFEWRAHKPVAAPFVRWFADHRGVRGLGGRSRPTRICTWRPAH